MVGDRLYLDHAAATPMLPAARERLAELVAHPLANPSSPHAEGRAWKDVLEDARTRVARALGCRPREVVFTGGGTEAAQIAVHGLAQGRAAASRRVVVSAVEHPAVLDPVTRLEKRGFEVIRVPVDADGTLPADRFVDAVGETAAFGALILANHEMGAIGPVAEVSAGLKERGIPLLCDAALGPGRLPCRAVDLGADVVMFSGAKLGGAEGCGILQIRRGTAVEAAFGGGIQEERLRPGTENVPAWAATALAFERALEDQSQRSARYDVLIDAFVEGLAALPEWRRVGPERGVPGLLTIEIPGVEGEALMINMDLAGVAVATGSTCALGSSDPSPSLLAMGFTPSRAASTVRVSVGEGLDTDSMKRAASTLCATVLRLRSLGRK